MKIPLFSQNEYVDQGVLNSAFGVVSGAIAGLGNIALSPGLYRPDAATLTVSGLNLTSVLTYPFAVVFASGDFVHPHGIVTNADTVTYVTPFSGVVPVSGSTTAYLIASYATIQQQPYQIVGPPPGHPDYNPAFIPVTAYAQTVETLSLAASTTPADNVATFELARFTLAAGASALGTPNLTFQNRTSSINTYQTVPVSGNLAIPVSGTGQVYNATAPLTYTLPSCAASTENWYGFLSTTSGTVNIQVQGLDLIYGTVTNPTSGITITTVPQGSYTALGAINGNWYVVASSQFGVTQATTAAIAAAVSGFIKYVNASGTQPTVNFQGGSNVLLTMPPSGYIPNVTVSGGVPSSGFNPGVIGALYIN